MIKNPNIVLRDRKIYYSDRSDSSKVAEKVNNLFQIGEQRWENGYIVDYDPATRVSTGNTVYSLTAGYGSVDWEQRKIVHEVEVFLSETDDRHSSYKTNYSTLRVATVKKSILYDKSTGVADITRLAASIVHVDPLFNFDNHYHIGKRLRIHVAGINYNLKSDYDLVLCFGVHIDLKDGVSESDNLGSFFYSNVSHCDVRTKLVYTYSGF